MKAEFKKRIERVINEEFKVLEIENVQNLQDKPKIKQAIELKEKIEGNLVLLLEEGFIKTKKLDNDALRMQVIDKTDDFTENDIKGLEILNDELVKLLSKRIFKDLSKKEIFR